MFLGNALGYVRMIKSGGLNFCSIATSFIPDLKKVMQFEGICNNLGFTKNCLVSGHHLDNVVHNICQNIAEGTNYFKVITVFKLSVNFLDSIESYCNIFFQQL